MWRRLRGLVSRVAVMAVMLYYGCKAGKEELLFWLERLGEFSSQPSRRVARVMEYEWANDCGQYYAGGRVARKGIEIIKKRFQCHWLETIES